jgi:uncharacterized protein with FMN-binding domain
MLFLASRQNFELILSESLILRKFKYCTFIVGVSEERFGGINLAKMNKRLVVLCSTALAAVYSAGYFTTETQASMQQTPLHTQSNIQTKSSQTNIQVNSSQTNRRYKDGTFTGTGSNRRGSIEVAVTIKNDKITDVEISNFAMHYSESDVVGLPDEVLQNQSPQVENVSGATYSTQAFEDSVQDALSQAQNS